MKYNNFSKFILNKKHKKLSMDYNNLDSLNVSLYDKNNIKESENENDVSPNNRINNKLIDIDNDLNPFKINPKEESKSSKFLKVNSRLKGKKNTFESKILSSKNLSKHNKYDESNLLKEIEIGLFNKHLSKNTDKNQVNISKNHDYLNYQKDKQNKTLNKNTNEGNITEKPTIQEKLTLSDLEMYYKFGIFPYIFFIHLLIIVFTTYIVYNFDLSI